MKKTTIFYITDSGRKLAERLSAHFPGGQVAKYASDAVEAQWEGSAALVFIMASGIVARSIAHLLKDKKTDPAVVVLDEKGKYAISLAGGHLGGANDLSREIAAILGGQAVITTASDVNELPSLDLWARNHDLVIENENLLAAVGARYLNNGALRVYSDVPMDLPGEFLRVAEPRFADAIITNRADAYRGTACGIQGDDCSIETCRVQGQLYLRPRNLVAGIGCNSGTSMEEIESAVRNTLKNANLSFLSIAECATIDIKAEEPGLAAFARKEAFPLRAFSRDELKRVEGVDPSEAVFRATGAHAVSEPAALLASGASRLLVGKQKRGNVTVAIAMRSARSESNPSRPPFDKGGRGGIFIVGTGPGSLDHITPAARNAIAASDVVVGYGAYLERIAELLKGKEVVSTGMTQEVDRCRKAVGLARDGKTVSVISGGDPGVYAMAGLVYEIMRIQESGVRSQEKSAIRNPQSEIAVQVIPGISALNAAAARLGAPLMHDFACISLSDRLTAWETIEKRLDAAAAADLVIVLYNPRSKGRSGHLDRARKIILRHRRPETAVGIVKGAMRDHEQVIVTDLAGMRAEDVDMQTTVIIGNSNTFVWSDLMITPRGYERKFEI